MKPINRRNRLYAVPKAVGNSLHDFVDSWHEKENVNGFTARFLVYATSCAYHCCPPRKGRCEKIRIRRYITMKEYTNQNRIYLDATDSVNPSFDSESATDKVADGLLLSYIDTLLSGNEN